MKNSKKIAMAGLIGLYSLNAIGQPINNDQFQDVKAEYTQNIEQQLEQTLEQPSNESPKMFTHANTGDEFNLKEIVKNKQSGVYINPFDDSQVITFSFVSDEGDVLDNKVKLSRELRKLSTNESTYNVYKELFGTSNYLSLHSHFFDIIDTSIEEKEKVGSFHTDIAEFDSNHNLNFINISIKQIEEIQEIGLKKGLSQESMDLILELAAFHEIGHSMENIAEQRKDFYQKISNGDIGFKNKEFLVFNLGDESFSDSFAFLQLAKVAKESGISLDTFKEVTDFFLAEVRDDSHSPKRHEFQEHLTKQTGFVTRNFIEQHWNNIDQLSNQDIIQLSVAITNLTNQNKKINPYVSNYEGQSYLSSKGGLSNRELDKLSDEVLPKINAMISTTLSNKGEVAMEFNYEPNAYKQTQSMKL